MSDMPTHALFKNLCGQRFDRLVVVLYAGKQKRNHCWKCRCDCGKEKIVAGCNLTSGNSKSCGCLKSKALKERLTIHGKSKTVEYQIWHSMWDRCRKGNDRKFKDYAGRGISVCERWKDFEAFLADMGPRPSDKHSLDRENNSKGYSPDNCRWATAKQQSRNTRYNRMLTCWGRTQCMAAWEEELGLSRGLIHARLKYGWSVERALSPKKIRKISE